MANGVQAVDVLFLHAGGANPRGLQGPLFPIGLIGLASQLEKCGYTAAIVNVLLEKILRPDFDLDATLKDYAPRLIGIDLHWFVHCYEAVELARACKSILPATPVVLGGLTASVFAEEILDNMPSIDFVIAGDAEKPMVELVGALQGSAVPLADVPNLVYRLPDGRVVRSGHRYAASTAEMDELDFLRFDLVHNFAEHLHLMNTDYLPLQEPRRTAELGDYYVATAIKNWVVYMGRGCPYGCSFCGGAASAHERASGSSLRLRSPATVADDILQLDALGFELVYISHSPLTLGSGYHSKLLDRIAAKRSRLSLGFIFEDCPFHVDLDIVGRYLSLFNPEKSIVRLYVAGVDDKAAVVNGLPANTRELGELVRYLSGRARVMVGALIGLPQQSRDSTKKMGELLLALRSLGARIVIYNAELHPASAIHSCPERYGASLSLKTFMDYHDFLEAKTDKSMTYGYTTANDVTLAQQRQILTEMLHGPEDVAATQRLRSLFERPASTSS